MAFNEAGIVTFTHQVWAAGVNTTQENYEFDPTPLSPLSGYPTLPGSENNYNLNYSLSGVSLDIAVGSFGTFGTSSTQHHSKNDVIGVLYNRNSSTELHSLSTVTLAAPINGGTATVLQSRLPVPFTIATINEENIAVIYNVTEVGTQTAATSGFKASSPDRRRRRQQLGI